MDETDHDKNGVYAHCSVREAITLSGNETADGYDLLRWGEMWAHKGEPRKILTADSTGVVFNYITTAEQKLLQIGSGRSIAARGAAFDRKELVQRTNRIRWNRLTQGNRDFIDSLYWIPQEPVSPLLALARVAEEDECEQSSD